MNKIVLFLLAALLMAACSGEDHLAREKKEMEAFMASEDLLVYRGLKATLRSLPAGAATDTSLSKVQRISFSMLRQVLGMAADSGYSLSDYFAAMSQLSELKQELAQADEDKYPTLLQSLFTVSGASAGDLLARYNSACEHIILGLTWTGMGAPENFSVYEIIRSDPGQIDDPLFRLAGCFIRGMVLGKRKWNYSAEKEYDAYLAYLEKNRKAVLEEAAVQELLTSADLAEDKLYASLHGPALLMRGFCKLDSDRRDEAEEDFELFVKDANRAGIDNEGVWLMRAYIAISNENKEEALAMLDKLAGSGKLRDEEKEIIAEVKGFLEEREKGKALNRITDKLFIAKVAYLYAEKQISAVDWYSKLRLSETGSKFSELTGVIEENYALLAGDVTGTIENKAKDLIDAVMK
ncbi:MAG: hypothetical protein AB1458_02610 [Bacteroidota bacterium]